MKTLYMDGSGFLHRLSARAKLVLLAAASLALFLIQSPLVLGVGAVASGLLFGSLRIGWRQTWLRLRVLFLTIAAVALFTLVFNSPVEAVSVFFRLSALALLASAVTATTTTGDFITEVTFAATPLEKLGLVKAADIGLSIGLVLRFIPEILLRHQAIRDAHIARGLRPRTLSIIVPLIILTLKNADEIASAIDARAIRAQK